MRRGKFVPELLPKSQLVVISLKLRWLHKTADLGSPVKISLLLRSIFFLLLDLVELGIVAGKFLQGDEEIAEVKAELLISCVESEQAFNKCGDLWSVNKLAMFGVHVILANTYA